VQDVRLLVHLIRSQGHPKEREPHLFLRKSCVDASSGRRFRVCLQSATLFASVTPVVESKELAGTSNAAACTCELMPSMSAALRTQRHPRNSQPQPAYERPWVESGGHHEAYLGSEVLG
jgi:hypothetical protein